MTRKHLLLSVPALVLGLGLVGCSGDDGGEEPDVEASATATADPSDGPVGAQVRKGCTAEVEMTGTMTASWSGKATVRQDEGAPTVYTAEDGKVTVTAYSSAEGFETTANIAGPRGTFTTPLGSDEGLDLDVEGSGGTVDADVVGLDDAEGHLTATFTCPEKGAGKGGKGADDQQDERDEQDGQDGQDGRDGRDEQDGQD